MKNGAVFGAAGTVCRGRSPGPPSPRVNPLRPAPACRGSLVGAEHEREVHGLARRSAVEAPLVGQGLDQEQAAAALRVGGHVRHRRQGARGVMHVHPQPTAGTADHEHDGLARLVPDGVGHQLAGEQQGGILVDGDLPGRDGGPDPAAGFGRCGRARAEPGTGPAPFGRTGRRHRGHRRSFARRPAGPEAGGRVALCSMSVDASIDATCIARHRSADGYWFPRHGRPASPPPDDTRERAGAIGPGWPGWAAGLGGGQAGRAWGAWGVVMEPGGGMTPGPLVSQASAAGSVSSKGAASRGGVRNAGRRRSSRSSMFAALASR